MKNTSYVIRFDDLGNGAELKDWQPWIDFLIRKNIKPVVCLIPDNFDSRIGGAKEEELTVLMSNLKKINAVFLVHGFRHNLNRKGKPFLSFYKSGELLNLENNRFQKLSEKISDIENRYLIKFSGYAPPAHMFDETFIEFVNFNSKNVSPIINDLYGSYPYKYRNVNFIPLLSSFKFNGLRIRFFSIHPKIDRKLEKLWNKIECVKFDINPSVFFKPGTEFIPVDKIPTLNVAYILFKVKFLIKQKILRLA